MAIIYINYQGNSLNKNDEFFKSKANETLGCHDEVKFD